MLMSSADSAPPQTPAELARTAREEARFGSAFLRVHGARLLLVFVGVLLPLWGFGVLVEELREGEPFAFDAPVLEALHALQAPWLDHIAVAASALGYAYGVIPVDILLVLVLAWRRHFREGLFAGLVLVGSALLNVGAKHAFARTRPALWDSIAPETTYSFPSGHAMGSITLAWVVVLLCWHLRLRGLPLRWPVLALAVGFTLLVGFSRVYLGVHYPSDILAGWAAASAWAAGVYALAFRERRPWEPPVRGLP